MGWLFTLGLLDAVCRSRCAGRIRLPAVLLTLGIDLASQNRDTAMCAIQWVSGRALVQRPQENVGDEEILRAMSAADWVGIDAPFGWPAQMTQAVHDFAHGGAWPEDATSDRLRYRTTDWFVHEFVAEQRGVSVWPLSVSSDRIAVCAWRCARLLTLYTQQTGWKLDRVGVPVAGGPDAPPPVPRVNGLVAAAGVVEVYPAAALALWGMPYFKGYKTTSAATAPKERDKRVAILDAIRRDADSWLCVPDDVRERLLDNDDAFDAFIASLVTCAAATGATVAPLTDQRGSARQEGWIHLPLRDSLAGLAPGTI